MRILRFIVDGQSIYPEPNCDFTGMFPGTKGYFKAEFSFSPEWNGCRKAAVFTKLTKDYPVPIVNNSCEIPAEALTWKSYKVSVIGEKDGYRITTNKVEVMQNG